MSKIIITILILYLLYKLVFQFIVPVSKTASQFKSQVSEMHRMQQEQLRKQKQQQQNESAPPPPTKASTKKPAAGTTDSEYIDFEEVK